MLAALVALLLNSCKSEERWPLEYTSYPTVDSCYISAGGLSGTFVSHLDVAFISRLNRFPFLGQDINRYIMTIVAGGGEFLNENKEISECNMLLRRYVDVLRDAAEFDLFSASQSSWQSQKIEEEGYTADAWINGTFVHRKGNIVSYLLTQSRANSLYNTKPTIHKPVIFKLAPEHKLNLDDVLKGGLTDATLAELVSRIRAANSNTSYLDDYASAMEENPYENFLFDANGMRWYLDMPLTNEHYEYTLSWEEVKDLLNMDIFKLPSKREEKYYLCGSSKGVSPVPAQPMNNVTEAVTEAPACEVDAEVAVPLDAEIDTDGDITRAAVNRDPRGNFLLEGDFMETGKIKCGLRDAGSYAPIYLHLEYYENVLYLTYSGGDRQELPLSEVRDGGQIRHYAMGSSQYYSYDSRFNKISIIRGFEVDGQGYWVEVVPAGGGYSGSSAPSNGSYNQQQMMQQQQDYQKQQLEQQYRSQYAMWEQTVQNTWNTLTGMVNGAARTSVRMQLRNAQSQMRAVRQNAQMQGVHIMASPWENASIPYGLDD